MPLPLNLYCKERVTMRIKKMLGLLTIAMAVALTSAAHAAHVIPIGLLSDFQGGTIENWDSQTTLTNIATGGPDGAGDRYLEVIPIPPPAGPGRLGIVERCHWGSGAPYCVPAIGPDDLADYVTNGITAIAMDLKNFGPDTVYIGLIITGNFDTCGRFTTANPAILTAGSGWQHVVFNLSEPDLIEAWAPNPPPNPDLAGCLARMKRLGIHHEPDPANWEPDTVAPVDAILGVDNVETLPEPTQLLMLTAGSGLLALLWRRRVTKSVDSGCA
jgi:hypothetical protein